MATITVPLRRELEDFIYREIKEGRAATKTHAVRQALELLREQRAFERILEAEEDIKAGRVHKGDLRKLLNKMPS